MELCVLVFPILTCLSSFWAIFCFVVFFFFIFLVCEKQFLPNDLDYLNMNQVKETAISVELSLSTDTEFAFVYISISVCNRNTTWKSPPACWYGPQNKCDVWELNSFHRQMKHT